MTDPWQERAAKGHWRGSHRLVPPRTTVERIAPLKAGMDITRVANVTGLDRIGIPVVMVCRPTRARSWSRRARASISTPPAPRA